MGFEAVVQQQSTAPQVTGLTSVQPQVEPAAQKEDDKISPKLQILMRREKVALERERAAKAKELEIENKYKSFTEREQKLAEFEAIKSTNPRRALELLGMSYQDLTQAELNDGQITPDIKIKQVESKFDSYVKSQEEALQRQQEESKRLSDRKNEETLEQFKGQINSFIKEGGPRYEFIEYEQSHDLVYDLIDEHYNRTLKAAQEKAEAEGRDPSGEVGEVMKTADAADKIEALLEQKYDKARSLTKLQALMAPKPGTNPILDKLKNPVPEQTSHAQKTLTNNLSASSVAQKKGIISDDDRIARAIAYARGLRS